jgi:hypothetical protein
VQLNHKTFYQGQYSSAQRNVSNGVTVIGSCRVRNPLMKLPDDGGYDLKWIASKPLLIHSFLFSSAQ